jgi:hypothetical protein
MNCKNCATSIKENDKFCPSCGGRVINTRLTFSHVWVEFSERVLSWDNKFFKTFLHLFTKPHLVIEDYVNGVRKKYFDPFSFLFLAITIGGLSLYLMKDMYALDFVGTQNPEDAKKIFDFTNEYNSILTLFFLPFYGLVSWIVFLNKKKYNFVEHNIIYIYTYSFTSILNTIAIATVYLINTALLQSYFIFYAIAFIFYNGYILKKIFKLTFWQIILKTLYFLLIGIFFYIIIIILGIIIMLIVMGPEEAMKYFAPQSV